MARTPSTMLDLGTKLPSFALPNTIDSETVRSSDFDGTKALLVMFICNHCPFVVHVKDELARITKDYAGKDLAIVGISSNDVTTHPDDHPDKMKPFAQAAGWDFPYLYDESQGTAKAFRAACTPDFFLFGSDRTLLYRGQLDDSRPGNDTPVTGKDLRAALDAVLSGSSVAAEQTPSIGCNIKWRDGNAPDYFG